ncbi:bifunctional riboflavin kinase/FAD synthetase [Paraconexibacter algicola]|uniref:Riboflavin biosynthesis protein n=1 Tax=Paraconexibacter algicola TaxID=2133960 RepID=A0A2T4UCI5_9ACTN|nr:bifunctional riboflavin kinase/FAD synthetase [Paraconexibacter algicola]PTL54912.1 bifunctional riboflavin kinase/FMN adenylyltransferase [Paraconexibacter algicola]
MKVTHLPDAEPRERRVAVGMFDGVHRGHREVIAGADTVLTFDPHPSSVVAPHAVPPLLTTLERKAELVGGLGIQELVVIPFDRDFASRSAASFVDDVLVGALGATHVSVGENFAYGHKAQGTTAQLEADPRFETRVVPLLEVGDEIVSSSHIRGLILGGAVRYADQLLVEPFVLDGEVSHGEKRGRTLGFPTANLVPPDGYVVPGHGVYACRVRLPDGSWHAAATNVGVRPQFETGLGELIEAYLIDFSGDLYGQRIRVEFLERLRGEKRFDSVEALVEQMHADVDRARDVAAQRS